MTWLHLTVPALLASALYSAHSGGLYFGQAGMLISGGRPGRTNDPAAIRAAWPRYLAGYGHALLTVLLALCAGFVAGRL